MLRRLFDFMGAVAIFGFKAVRDAFRPPFEFEMLMKQFFDIGIGSLPLIVAFFIYVWVLM